MWSADTSDRSIKSDLCRNPGEIECRRLSCNERKPELSSAITTIEIRSYYERIRASRKNKVMSVKFATDLSLFVTEHTVNLIGRKANGT